MRDLGGAEVSAELGGDGTGVGWVGRSGGGGKGENISDGWVCVGVQGFLREGVGG